MGMYCCCEKKIGRDGEWKCECNWNGWINVYDWPPERKNKELPFASPEKEGKYLVRYQLGSGDRVEDVQTYCKTARKSKCGYTGKEMWLNWSDDDEAQPYAWSDINE